MGARLRAALLDLMGEHREAGAIPTSCRFRFYELVARGVIPKTRTGARRPDQDMNEALTWLRERGLVAWDEIVDETRTFDAWHAAPTVRQWVKDVLEQARVDPMGR
jgi:hypothetical protein